MLNFSRSNVITIKPSSSWFDYQIHEIYKYRDLLFLFVKRDFMVQHAQSILGPLWYILTPLISTAVFVVVFGKIAQVPTDGLPHILFYLSGLSLWNFFGGSVGKTQDVLYLNVGIYGRIYFPRIIIPLSYIISSLVPYLAQVFGLAISIAYFVFFKGFVFHVTWELALLPVLLILTGMLSLGIGLIVSSLSYRYRDFIAVSGFFLSMLMYASPIVYPASRIPENWRDIFFLNPLAPLIESYRHCIFGTGALPLEKFPLAIAIIFGIFFIGFTLFNKVQKSFIDTV